MVARVSFILCYVNVNVNLEKEVKIGFRFSRMGVNAIATDSVAGCGLLVSVWRLVFSVSDGSVSRYRIVGTNRQGFLLCCVLVGEVEDGCYNERLFAGFDSVTYFSTMMDTLIGKIYS